MRVLFSPHARAELKDAAAHYEMELEGLGRVFKREVRQAASRISAFPYGWTRERGDVRRYVLHRFPYKILYAIEQDYIYILAVAHQHRRPDYWIDER
jgi:plasmid stabilization system protein ParE